MITAWQERRKEKSSCTLFINKRAEAASSQRRYRIMKRQRSKLSTCKKLEGIFCSRIDTACAFSRLRCHSPPRALSAPHYCNRRPCTLIAALALANASYDLVIGDISTAAASLCLSLYPPLLCATKPFLPPLSMPHDLAWPGKHSRLAYSPSRPPRLPHITAA